MSSQYPNDGSSSPKFFSDSSFELFEEFNVLVDDIQELMGDQDTGISNLIPAGGSIQQSLTTPSVEFGSNSFPIQNSSTAYGGSSYCPNSFSPQNSLPGQLSPDQPSNYACVGSSYWPGSFSAQNSLSGRHPPNQPSTANVGSSFSVQNSFPGHPQPNQSSTACVGSSYYPNVISVQNSFRGQRPPNQPLTANVGSSYPNSFSGLNSFPGQLPPRQPSTTNARTSYCPDNFSAQNSLLGQLPPNQSSNYAYVRSSYRQNSFSMQNSVRGQHLVNQPPCQNNFSVQKFLPGVPEQIPPIQPSTAYVGSSGQNNFSGPNSLPGVPSQPSNANVGRSRPNSFSGQTSLPGQFLAVSPSTANVRSSCPNSFSGQTSLPGQILHNYPYTENVGSSSSISFSAVQNFLPGQHLPNQTSTANIRSSGPNNAAAQNFSPRRGRPPGNPTSRGRAIRRSGPYNFTVGNFSSVHHLLSNRTTSTANIRSSIRNNLSVENFLRIQHPTSGANTRSSNLDHAGNILQESENPNNFPVQNLPAQRQLNRTPSGDVIVRRSNPNPAGNSIQPQDLASFSSAGTNNFPGLLSSQISSGDVWSSNLNSEARNIQPNPLVGSNNFPGLVSSQISSGDVWSSNLNPAGNIQPNPLVSSNNFSVPAQDLPGGHLLYRTSILNPLPELPEQLPVPDHQTTGGNCSNINPDYIHLQQNLEVVVPLTHQNNTSTELMVPSDHAGNTGDEFSISLDTRVGFLSEGSGSNQPTGDQNTNTLQGDAPVQIGGGNNSRDGGPLLPPMKINSAGKREKSEDDCPPLAQGLSWIYSKKKPGTKRRYVDKNCSDSFKRLCKSTGEKFLPNEYFDGLQGRFRFMKYPGESSGVEKNPGETNGSEKNSGRQTSGAPDKGKGIAYGQKKWSTQDRLDFHTNTIAHEDLLSLECEKEYERLKRIFASRTVPNQGTTGGESSVTTNTSTILPPPPSGLGNSSVNGAQAPLVVIEGSWSNNFNTVTTEIAVVPLVSSSSHHATAAAEVTQGSDTVNTVESLEVMVMETNNCVRVEEDLTDADAPAAAPEPEDSWPEEFNKLIGYDQED